MSQVSLHGFTLIRNGLKYDYPFLESLQGLRGLCDSVVVAVGKSEDGTEEALKALDLVSIPTIWDETKRQGGLVLSEQTNIALEELRKKTVQQPGAWGFYLQGDEAISETDFARIKHDLVEAEKQGCDCISFRYLHFWQSYERIAISRRWYPQEIRCVKLDSRIESYGDAQSFRHWNKRYESEAIIYHYGHVREPVAYEKKKLDFHRLWHSDSEMAEVIAKGERGDRKEEVLRYLGPHPKVMRDRIKKHGGASLCPRRAVKVFGLKNEYSPDFLHQVNAELEWTNDEALILKEKPEDVVLLRSLSRLANLFSFGKYRSQVPRKMGSPQAREWTKDFYALLRFSEKGVRVVD